MKAARQDRPRSLSSDQSPEAPYNRFWVDTPTKVIGTRRTSLVVDPPDGRVPPLTPGGEKRQVSRQAARQAAANPEDMPVPERCILGFNAGPPIIPAGYNQNLQLADKRQHVGRVLHTQDVGVQTIGGAGRRRPLIKRGDGFVRDPG